MGSRPLVASGNKNLQTKPQNVLHNLLNVLVQIANKWDYRKSSPFKLGQGLQSLKQGIHRQHGGRLSVRFQNEEQKTPWPESASELYRPSDRRLSTKLVPTFADRGCHLVSVSNPYGRILGSLDRSPYFFFLVAAQLYSRGWVDPVPDPLLLRKCGSAGNRTRTPGSLARNSEH
jgi:hypothetical protein